jgi:ABC-type maltose transport system permease subunit
MTFVGIFNEYIMSRALLKSPNDMLLAQGLQTFSTQYSTKWGQFAAATVLSCVPLAIIWGFSQKYVESGLTRGAVKG